ncbi:unnamed protein product [Rhodiola kirilowii]
MVASSSYEECRRQRLEENRKRMEELNLLKLSKSLAAAASPKPSPAKPKSARKAVDLSAVRRSTRVADKPMPNYKEGVIEPLERLRRVPHSYRRRDLLNRVYASDDSRMYAVERAESLESELGSEFPIFVKPMLQSHVTGGFWLGLPQRFCSTHMPKEDEMITLEDEEGNKSLSKYLADRTGLSGGWRGFAIDHELVDGDALVFQLVKPTKFKVYIIRVNEHENEDGEADVNGDGDMDSDVVSIDTVPVTEPEEVSEPSPGTRRSKRKKSSRK